MINSLVTIGVPVYNVETYIEKCLFSALNQTYDNLELLIIDDCGSDNSIQIVEKIQKEHNRGFRIQIIRHTYNKGLGEARNTAIKHAKGKYIYFLDSDDYIEPTTIELMVNEAEQNNADAVFSSCRKIIYGSNAEVPTFVYSKKEIIRGEDSFAHYLCQDLRWHIGINAWNILFRIDYLHSNNILFAARKDEDALFISDFYSEIKCAVLLPNITYNYVLRPGSIMGNQAREHIPTAEIRERFITDAKMTERCQRLKNRNFYDVHCARVMKHKFRAVCVALRHRHRFTEPLSSGEIREELRHPATFNEIIWFKRYRMLNIFFYALYNLPPSISIGISYAVGKMIRWI